RPKSAAKMAMPAMRVTSGSAPRCSLASVYFGASGTPAPFDAPPAGCPAPPPPPPTGVVVPPVPVPAVSVVDVVEVVAVDVPSVEVGGADGSAATVVLLAG